MGAGVQELFKAGLIITILWNSISNFETKQLSNHIPTTALWAMWGREGLGELGPECIFPASHHHHHSLPLYSSAQAWDAPFLFCPCPSGPRRAMLFPAWVPSHILFCMPGMPFPLHCLLLSDTFHLLKLEEWSPLGKPSLTHSSWVKTFLKRSSSLFPQLLEHMDNTVHIMFKLSHHIITFLYIFLIKFWEIWGRSKSCFIP